MYPDKALPDRPIQRLPLEVGSHVLVVWCRSRACAPPRSGLIGPVDILAGEEKVLSFD